jgi:hypothetical protein
MKKVYTIFSILALFALSFGCAKEIDLPQDELLSQYALSQPGDESTVTVVFSVPEYAEPLETKTALGTKDGSSYPVRWSTGDQNRVSLNGSAPTESTKDSDTQISASFKPTSGLSVYNFLYRGVDGHDNQVSIPASQTYYANDFDDAAMPMYAASATRPSGTVTFNHLCALLKFSITGSFASGKGILSMNLKAVAGDKSLSGNFTIGKNGSGLLNGTLTPASGGGTINYSFGSYKRLTGTATVFYVAIPAGTYTGGIQCEIVDNDSGHMEFKVLNDNNTITAGKVRELGTFEYVQSKITNLHEIKNDATLLSFVSEVNGGNKTLNARVTTNLDLTSATVSSFNSIVDYEGVFDGNGKTISGLTKPLFSDLKGVVKNLTLNSSISITDASDLNLGIFARQVIPGTAIDDIGGLKNCTATGSITFTPSAALSGNPCLGGLVGNNRGGAFISCTNEATVTLADNAGVTHTGDRQPSIGGVIGRTQKGGDLGTQGSISDCTNSGTVICAEQFEGNIMIGGVVGYGVEVAENISGCTNSGLVQAASTCTTTKVLHIGGVAGMYKGEMESCSNLTAGTVTTESGSAAGTQLNQGGVVGRLNNGNGDYSGLTNAGTVNVAATGGSTARLIGGVVGRCNEGSTITELTNSGNINYTATATNATYIGGVVASNTVSGVTLENCRSTGGTLTVSNTSHSNMLFVGGVVGYSTKAVTSCSNAMTITTTGSMTMGDNNYLCYGGVIGYFSGAKLVTSCTNSGAINFGQSQSGEGQLYIGGIAGAVTGAEISGGGNSGTITFTGQNTKRPPSVGGIVGRVFSNTTDSGYSLNNNVTNSGSIIFNSSVSGSQYMYAGGLVGQHLGGNIYGTNDAPITVTELHESMMALGGIVGYLAGGTVSNGTNTANGDIAVNGFISGYHSYVGGIVGIASGGSSIAAGGGTITGASNAGDVTVAAGCTIPRNNYIGGVIGYAGNDVSNASNTGNVVNNYSQGSSSNATSYHMNIAGVAAHSVADLTDCYNTGNVTNNGSTYKSEINVSGVVGISEGNLTRCSNGTNSLAGGTITNTATSGTNSRQDGQFAGVISNNKGNTTVTSCFNKGAVQNSGACSSISIGGVVAWTTGGTTTYTGCYNTGNITNTGTGSDGTAGVRMGGVAGSVSGANTFTGNSTTYNYNKGVLLENSASTKVAVGGVCGYTFSAASDFAYAKSLYPDGDDVDDIVIEGNARDKVYVGGIIGMSAVTSSFDNTYNSSDIRFLNLELTQSGQVFGGGIIGGWTAAGVQTINGCENEGWVYTNNSAGDLAVADSENKPKYWSCFGGIAGMGSTGTSEGLSGGFCTITGKTFTNCSNSGTIRIYAALRCCIGGVVAYTENNPSGCVCTANIRPYLTGGIGTVDGNYHRNICGGVVGYCTSSTLSNLKYSGELNTNSSSPFAYTGGITGLSAGNTTYSGCKVGGTIHGTNSGDGLAGLFCNSNENYDYSFSSCVIESGTRARTGYSNKKVLYATISSSSDITMKRLCGPNKTPTNSDGTMASGVSVGSID